MLWASAAWVGFCSAELAVVETPISKCETPHPSEPTTLAGDPGSGAPGCIDVSFAVVPHDGCGRKPGAVLLVQRHGRSFDYASCIKTQDASLRMTALGLSTASKRLIWPICLAAVVWLCGLGWCGVGGGAGLWSAPFARAGYVELVRGVVWVGGAGKGVEQAV